MPFKLSEEFKAKRQAIEDLKMVIIDGQEGEVHVSTFPARGVTPEEYGQMRMNSYARDDFFPKMNDELLLKTAQYYLDQCGRPARTPSVTYNEAVIHNVLPELIKRLEEKINETKHNHT